MNTTKIVLLKQNGEIKYKDFCFVDDFKIVELEILIENEGRNFELVEEGCLNSKYFMIFGYKSGENFSKHEFNYLNLFGDAIMIICNDESIVDATEIDIHNYFSYEIISSDESLSLSYNEDDEYDFTDGFLINDL